MKNEIATFSAKYYDTFRYYHFGLHELIYYIYQPGTIFYSIAVPRVLLDLGIEKKVIQPSLRLSLCTASSILIATSIDQIGSNSLKSIDI